MLECLDSWRLAGLRRRCGEGLLRASLSASYSCYLFYVSTLMCLSLWPNSPFCKGSSSAGLRLTPLPHFKLITLWTPTFQRQASYTEILRVHSVDFSLKRTQVNPLSHNYYFSVNFSFDKRELNQACGSCT